MIDDQLAITPVGLCNHHLVADFGAAGFLGDGQARVEAEELQGVDGADGAVAVDVAPELRGGFRDVDLLAHGRAVAAVGVQAGIVAESDERIDRIGAVVAVVVPPDERFAGWRRTGVGVGSPVGVGVGSPVGVGVAVGVGLGVGGGGVRNSVGVGEGVGDAVGGGVIPWSVDS